MSVRLRGFGDLELRLRPVPGETLDGELVTLDARAVGRLLRDAVAEVPPQRLRSLLLHSRFRGRAQDDAAVLSELRRLIDRGELVFVRRPLRTVDPGVFRSEPRSYIPAEPEGIVEPDDWIEILVVDEDDEPVRCVAYELELPNGSIRRGRTNQHGIARCARIHSGTCKLTLVEFDASAWSLG